MKISVQTPQRYSFVPRLCHLQEFINSYILHPRTQTGIFQQRTVLSTAFLMDISQTAPQHGQLQHIPPPCTQAFPSLRFHC